MGFRPLPICLRALFRPLVSLVPLIGLLAGSCSDIPNPKVSKLQGHSAGEESQEVSSTEPVAEDVQSGAESGAGAAGAEKPAPGTNPQEKTVVASEAEHAPPPTPTFLRSPILGNRKYMGSHLEHIFFAPGADNSEIAEIIQKNVYSQVAFFGGPCNIKSADCPGDPTANALVEALAKPSTARSGYLIGACDAILSLDQAVVNVMASLNITRSDKPNEEILGRAVELFLPGNDLTPKLQKSVRELYDATRNEGSSGVDGWRIVFSAFCAASDDEITHLRASRDAANPKDVFDRCYSQLTQNRFDLHRNESIKALRQSVTNGEKSPAEACTEVLNLADLTKNERVEDQNTIGRMVLNTLHDVHASWLRKKRLGNITYPQLLNGSRAIHDPEQPAFYFTKALFDEGFPFSQVMTSQSNLTAVRTDMDPYDAGPDSGITKNPNAASHHRINLDEPQQFAPRGELLGIQAAVDWTKSYTYTHNYSGGGEVKGSADLGQHYGGGFIGSQSYLLMNLDELLGFRSNGVGKVPRRWARSVYHDLLCRELPVVRAEDVSDLVVENSEAGFRNSWNCTRCHASGDRLATTIRGIEYRPYPRLSHLGTASPQGGMIHMGMRAPENGFDAETGWPDQADRDFYRRPPNGVIFYRNHAGELVNTPVTGLADVGAKFAQLEAPYVCLAKRYYHYFTGLNVYIGDLDDASMVAPLNESDLAHRDYVIQLGKQLKEHQNPKKVISSIFASKFYQQGQ